MSFTFGLFVGFFLGILCMVLLFLAKSSEVPTISAADNPTGEKSPALSTIAPPEVHSHPPSKD